MYYIICYDIENDSTRTKLAKNLQKYGAIRIQKSVFLADASLQSWQGILDCLANTPLDKKAIDNIVILPLEQHQLISTLCLGKNEALENLKNPVKIVVF